MAIKKFQYYDTGDDSYETQEDSEVLGQTFTPQKLHYLTRIKMKSFRLGSPGTLTVGIRPTSSGLPTNIDDSYQSINNYLYGQTFTTMSALYVTSIRVKAYRIGSPGTLNFKLYGTDGSGLPDSVSGSIGGGSFDCDTLTTDPNGEWVSLPLDEPVYMDADTAYAITGHISAFVSETHEVRFRMNSAGAYSDGSRVHRIGGNDWEFYTGDILFELWGSDAARFEYYNTGDDDYMYIDDADYAAQTFTPDTNHFLQFIKLKVYRSGDPGTITVEVTAVDGDGKPTGSALSSGTFDGDAITDSSPGEWVTIPMSEYQLVASTQYAIVVKALEGDVSNWLAWRVDFSGSASYAGGEAYWTTSSTYESYTTGDDDYTLAYDINLVCQTFLTTSAHKITSVKLKLYRGGGGGLPGTTTISIHAVDGSHFPTGAALTSGTFDADTITNSSAGEWVEIALTEYSLADATEYAIVIDAPNGDAANYVGIRLNTASSYSDGYTFESYDDGASWEDAWGGDPVDCMFEVIGAGWDNEGETLDMMFEEWGGVGYKDADFSQNLSFGTLDVDSITTDSGGEWITIDLNWSVLAEIGTEYAIVPVISNFNSGVDEFYWLMDASSPTYSQGDAIYYTGAAWEASGGSEDFMFEEWGEEVGRAKGLSVPDMAAMMMKT